MNVPHSFIVVLRLILAGLTSLASSTLLAGTPTLDKALTTWAAPAKLPQYRYALVDLNGDSILDAIVLIFDPDYCGTGGCNMVIFKGTTDGFKLVSTSSITREPILLHSEVRYGWHTLSVLVAGGGVATPGQALMRFNGTKYPMNPSLQVRAASKDIANAKTLQLN